MIVVGLDTSLTCTGVAVYRDTGTGKPSIELHSVRSVNEGDGYDAACARITNIRDQVMRLVPRDADLVLMEAPAFGANTGKLVERYWLWGKVFDALVACHLPKATIVPTQLKKFVIGKGSGEGTKKLHVALKVTKMWPGIELTTDDEADAAGLAMMGAVHLRGRVPFNVLENHKLAMAKVVWP